MRVQTKRGVLFVTLPKRLYAELKEKANGVEFIDLDMAVYLINLVITNAHKDKSRDYDGEYVRLCSKYLKVLNYEHYKYNKHFNWLKANGFIDIANHSNYPNSSKRCKGYKIKEQFLTSTKQQSTVDFYAEHACAYTTFSKKVTKNVEDRKREARCYTPHLTKWLDNDGFEMDSKAAHQFVEKVYGQDIKPYKRDKRTYAIKSFNKCRFNYTRDGKGDRLHHYFVQLPSDLKQFIKFNGLPIKEVDIKSSQPFILTCILELIIDTYKSSKADVTIVRRVLKQLLKKLINNRDEGYYKTREYYKLDINKIVSNTIIYLKTLEPIDFKEISTFISQIRDGDIYNLIGDELLAKGVIYLEDEKYFTLLNEEDNDGVFKPKLKDFETLRKCAKTIALNTIYSSPNTRIDTVKEVKKLFPTVMKLLDVIKGDNYKVLPILMQRIEAKCILDHCSKEIAKKHPDMLLIARHDSLSTTEDNFDKLKSEFQYLINNYFNVEVDLDDSDW